MQPLTIQAPGAETLARPMRRRGRPLLFVNATALMFVAPFLRVYRLDTIPGINGDEARSGVQSLWLLGGGPVDWWTPNGNPINFFFIIP